MSRSCGTCTKCCEGYLEGSVDGISFFSGKPCHFVDINKGCTRYETRPKEPCQTYTCAWITDINIPEWMKPDKINAIIDFRVVENIEYISVIEAGEPLRSDVLTMIIKHAINNGKNLFWQVKGGKHWIGSKEFLSKAQKTWSQ